MGPSKYVPYHSTLYIKTNSKFKTLTDNMTFLHNALGVAPFRRVWYEALNTLQELLWNDIFMRERFTTLGAAQFFRDLTALWAVIDKYVVDGSASALGMPKLREAATLLNLPIASGDGVMSLRSAYERIFSDNAEAKKVVDELGFSTITYHEARKILQSRVEASE
jgi:RAD50-interacting protein 1